MTQEASLTERIVDGIRAGTARAQIKLAAARGALPLPRPDLVLLQVLLYADPDAETKNAALESLQAVTPDIAHELAEDEGTSREVLHFLAGWLARWPDVGACIARRNDPALETMIMLAESNDEATLEALVSNQVVLRMDARLRELLLANPALTGRARGALLDYVDEISKDEAAAAALEEQQQADEAVETEDGDVDAEEDEELAPAGDPFLAALGIDAEVEAMLPELGLDVEALSERSELLGDDLDEDEDGLVRRLSKMNVGQKLRVALFGTKEERTILVRDSNRIVAQAVIKNPKFTESEADSVAKSRNVSTDVLRLIGRHRDFAKSYSIKHSLITNPRTPFDVAVGFLPMMNDKDLKMLQKNRNVADVVRRQAKKIFMTREARKQGRRPGA